MSMYSISYICKDKISSEKHSHQLFYYIYNYIIYKSQQHSTSLWSSPNFQSIIQAPPNIYSSLCIHKPTHNPSPLRTLPSPLKPPQFLLKPQIIWTKLILTLQPNNSLPVLMMTMPNNIKNSDKEFPNKIKNLITILISSSIPCHFSCYNNLINGFKNEKKNCSSWQTSYHHKKVKMKCLLSPLKLHLLNIAFETKLQAKFDKYDQNI